MAQLIHKMYRECEVIDQSDRTAVRPDTERGLLWWITRFLTALLGVRQSLIRGIGQTVGVEPIVILLDLTRNTHLKLSAMTWYYVVCLHRLLSKLGGGVIVRLQRLNSDGPCVEGLLYHLCRRSIPVVYAEVDAIELWDDYSELYRECASQFTPWNGTDDQAQEHWLRMNDLREAVNRHLCMQRISEPTSISPAVRTDIRNQTAGNVVGAAA